jgi:hypothetical protein
MLESFSSPDPTLILCTGVLASSIIYYLQRQKRVKSTPLRSPPNPSLLFGAVATLKDFDVASEAYEKWAQEFGPVYMVPAALGKVRMAYLLLSTSSYLWD